MIFIITKLETAINVAQFPKTDKINISVLIAIWLFMVILVNPLGDFPMIDDWVYGLSVKSILEKGDFRLPAYANANVFAQAFWGALFCLPFGFSFTALRFSTLTLGLVGVLVTYALLREVNANPKVSLIGALLVALNPIYFVLSNTFMTDVPFFAFFVLSFYFLICGLKQNSNIKIIIGLIVSYIALLIRQLGLIISLAFAGAYLVKKGFNWQNAIKAVIPISLGFFLQFFYTKWLYSTGRIPPIENPQYRLFSGKIIKGLVFIGQQFSIDTLLTFIYIGAFIFPLLIIRLSNKFNTVDLKLKKKLIIFGIVAFWVSIIGRLLLKEKQLMPLKCCHLDFGFGIGPLFHLRQPIEPFLGSLSHGKLKFFQYSAIPLSLKMFWIFLTAIGVFSAALLIYCLWLAISQIFRKNKTTKYLNILAISAIVIYLLLISISGLMDRYLLPLLPLFMVTVLLPTENINKSNISSNITFLILTVMLFYGGFTIAATHDYLSRDRTVWKAAHNLIQESQVSPKEIDGGYEFNGWFNPNKRFTNYSSTWWIDNANYIISSGSLPGYKEVKRYPFRRWLTFQEANIIVLRKTPELNSARP